MFPPLTPAVRSLLIANCVVFLVQLIVPQASNLLALWPLGASTLSPGDGFMPWQLLTAGFTHVGWLQLLFNMFMLWMFGSALEMVWGQKRFLTYYFVCLIGANLLQLLLSSWALAQQLAFSTYFGASAAVLGLLLGYAMYFPNQRMIVFPIPMEIRARTLVIVYGAVTLLFAVTGLDSWLNSVAPLGGMLFGWLLIRYWRGQPPFNKRRPPGPRLVR